MAERHLLLVDDEPFVRLLLRKMLEQDGHRVVEAGSRAEALARAAEEPPALALVDLHLGDSSGPELIRDLRGLPGLASLPSLLVTGSESVSEGDLALAGGVRAVLRKSNLQRELCPAVRRCLGEPEAS
jgi:CheY-like chemotaxis protein